MEPDPNPPIVTPWYADKAVHAVLTFVVGVVASVVGRKFGFAMNVEEIVAFAMVIMSFILGHKWKTAKLQEELLRQTALAVVNAKAAGK